MMTEFRFVTSNEGKKEKMILGAVFVLYPLDKFKTRAYSAFVFHLFSALHHLIRITSRWGKSGFSLFQEALHSISYLLQITV